MPHFLHHGVVHRHTLEHIGQRVQPDGAAHALLLRGSGLFRIGPHLICLFAQGCLRAGHFVAGGLQIHRGGNIVQAEIRLGLLLHAHGFKDTPRLIVGNDARALLHIQQIFLGHAALLGHLLGAQAPARAFQLNQIAQSAHKQSLQSSLRQ